MHPSPYAHSQGPGVGSLIDARYRRMREKMIEALRAAGIRDENVLAVMAATPRELFVDPLLRLDCYGNHALPIEAGQTISQPYIVARMTELLELTPKSRVLEIGAGSGYQTAILARLATQVFGMERIGVLARLAQSRLRELKLFNATVKCFDGTMGWSSLAPFDAITVAAAGPEVPRPLLDQLAVGGRLVLPVGDEKSQRLYRIVRTETGFHQEIHGNVNFVPLIGRYGHPG